MQKVEAMTYWSGLDMILNAVLCVSLYCFNGGIWLSFERFFLPLGSRRSEGDPRQQLKLLISVEALKDACSSQACGGSGRAAESGPIADVASKV
jgi:hypothetical protein